MRNAPHAVSVCTSIRSCGRGRSRTGVQAGGFTPPPVDTRHAHHRRTIIQKCKTVNPITASRNNAISQGDSSVIIS